MKKIKILKYWLLEVWLFLGYTFIAGCSLQLIELPTNTTQNKQKLSATVKEINAKGLVQKILTSHPIEGLQVLPIAKKLLVESGMQLYALPDQGGALSSLIKKIEFDQPIGFIRLPLEADNGWLVNGDNTVTTLEDTGVWITDLKNQLTRRQIHLPDNNDIYLQVLLANDGETLIAETAGGKDPDYMEHSIVKINISEKSVQKTGEIRSIDDLLIEWAPETESFIIFDTGNGSLWRWERSSDQPQKIYPQKDSDTTVVTELGLEPQGRWISLLHENVENGQFHIEFLSVGSGDIEGKLKLPAGYWQQLQWHPTRDVFVSICEDDDQASMRVLDKKGNTLAEQPVPQTWVINGMVWSGDGQSLYIGGDKCLYLWTLPDHLLDSK